MKRNNKNIKIIFKYVIVPLFAAWLFYSLYNQLKNQPDLHQSLRVIRDAPFGEHAFRFWLVIALAAVNWGIEARKWQVLLKPLQQISFLRAYKSVLSGLAISLNTPNRIGEYGGRILYVDPGKRLKAISLSIAGSISQLIITILMGCGGLVYLLYFSSGHEEPIAGLSVFWIRIFLLLSLMIACIIILFYFRLSWISRLIEKIPGASKWIIYIKVLEEFTAKLLLRLLSLSFFRYLVFVIQYILLLQVLHIQMAWTDSFWIVTVLFIVMAIVPSFAIADLGIRGRFSIELFHAYSRNTVGILGTTFGIWLINLFIPAVAGSILILSVKIFKEKNRS